MALTKNEIVTAVHELGFTKKKSVDIVESLLEIIKNTLGTWGRRTDFRVRKILCQRKEQKARPQSGDRIRPDSAGA